MAYDPYGDVKGAQDLLKGGVEAYGEQMRPHLLREIGNALGSLNSIGALRSGGSEVAIKDISRDYTDRIGLHARQTASDALGYGLRASDMRFREAEARRARRASLLKGIGTFLGAGAGFLLSGGNPAGAAAGASLAGGLGGSDATYDTSDMG